MLSAYAPYICFPLLNYASIIYGFGIESQDTSCLSELMLEFSHVCSKKFASHVAISNFHVGAIARGGSGTLYVGANTEFYGTYIFICYSHAYLVFLKKTPTTDVFTLCTHMHAL